MTTETYKRRTVRPVQTIVHLLANETGERLCNLEYEAAKPVPTVVFHKGDAKVPVVKLSCPVCNAIAILLTEAHALAAEEQFGIANNDRKQTA